MRIAAIDFETANSSSCSACSLGISLFEEGEFAGEYEFMIKPHPRYFYFTNTFIHHISAQDYDDDDHEFPYFYSRIRELLENSMVVAHNAAFDVGVLNSICTLYGLDNIPFTYIDSVRLSRIAYPELYNHKLNTVCEYLGIDLNHHNASSDANGSLMILLNVMDAYSCFDVIQLAKRLKLNIKENR